MSKHLVTLTDPSSPASEAFRTLRTNLIFYDREVPLHTLLITSATQESDSAHKSNIIANLAVTMAQSGRPTLLVDCDLRQPKQHKIWAASNEEGLTTALLEDRELPIREIGIENLSLITSGPPPPNPADLLGSRKMDTVIKRMQELAEIVLFDAPPVLAVTDSAVLAAKLDGVLLVFSAGQTRVDHAARARVHLERINIKIIGAVLNNAPTDPSLVPY